MPPRRMLLDADSVDVVVAGLGPVGATLSALLGQAGLRVLALEPSTAVYPLPRAAHLDHEVMRILQSLGIVDRLAPHLRAAPDYEFLGVAGQPFMRIERAGVLGASGWPVSFNIYQPGIEAEIRRLLATLPTVQAAFGSRFDALLRNDDQGVVVRLSTDGLESTVTARCLVGCDGAWSPVRSALGIALDDYAFDEPWLVLDAQVADESGFPRANLQRCDPDRPTTFVHMGPGRLRWEFMLKPGEDPQAMQQPQSLDELLRPWRAHGAIEVERSAVYRFHGLVAPQWRVGRVLLAGDAAHQMPPFMGQGLCGGLRDAVNLGWKIEQACRLGWNEALLDSYQQEREPHVRFIVEKAIEMGRLVCTLDADVARRRDAELLAAPRVGRPMPFPPFASGWLMSGTPAAGELFPQPVDRSTNLAPPLFLDDVLDRRAWLLIGEAAAADAEPAEAAGVRIVRLASDLTPALRAPITEWLADRHVDAVLVRPDRYVFGTGRPQALLEAWRAGLSAHSAAGRPPHYPARAQPPLDACIPSCFPS